MNKLKSWWHRLTREPEQRMARCAAELSEVLDWMERSGALTSVAGRRPKGVLRLMRKLGAVERELRTP